MLSFHCCSASDSSDDSSSVDEGLEGNDWTDEAPGELGGETVVAG